MPHRGTRPGGEALARRLVLMPAGPGWHFHWGRARVVSVPASGPVDQRAARGAVLAGWSLADRGPTAADCPCIRNGATGRVLAVLGIRQTRVMPVAADSIDSVGRCDRGGTREVVMSGADGRMWLVRLCDPGPEEERS